ncbi:MAG: hypothetical protein QM399_03805 [Bacillota bacterium]|nr:hypothetical protein [Bacillota bacterium]
MIQQPDQFQSRVYVRLPFSDKYLENEAEAKKIRDQLSQLFQKPIIKKTITPVQPQMSTPIPPRIICSKSSSPAH